MQTMLTWPHAFPCLSISHSHGYALCALCAGAIPSPSGGGQSVLPTVGVDIELTELRGHNFAADFFTDAEIDCIGVAPPALRELLTTAIWRYKPLLALWDRAMWIRSVECLFDPAQPKVWTPFRLTLHDLPAGEPCGWWRTFQSEWRGNALC